MPTAALLCTDGAICGPEKAVVQRAARESMAAAEMRGEGRPGFSKVRFSFEPACQGQKQTVLLCGRPPHARTWRMLEKDFDLRL